MLVLVTLEKRLYYRINPAVWGLVSGLAYFWIVYEIWMGSASKLAAAAGGAVQSAHKTLLVRSCRLGYLSYWIYGWY